MRPTNDDDDAPVQRPNVPRPVTKELDAEIPEWFMEGAFGPGGGRAGRKKVRGVGDAGPVRPHGKPSGKATG